MTIHKRKKFGHIRDKLTPSAEVLRVEVGSLGRGETVPRVGVVAHGMLAGVQLSRDLGKALRHETLVDEAANLSRVVGHVLLAHLVRGPADPVHRVLAVVAVNVAVDLLRRWQGASLLCVALVLETVEAGLIAAREADFSVDAAGRLAEHRALGGHESCVAGQVLPVVGSALGRGVAGARHLFLSQCKNLFNYSRHILLLNHSN